MERKGARDESPLHRHLPVTAWLSSYRREWLAGDIAAGLTAWAITIPTALAYAGIAGVPVQYGLYAACLSLIGYALFGTSRHLYVGPAAAAAAVSAATVAPLVTQDPGRYISLTAALALMVGVLFVIGGLARLGFIAKFFARPVFDGFIVGLALFIAVGQLGKLFGIGLSGENAFEQLADILRQVGSWSWVTLGVGAACLLALYLFKRYLPRFPAALMVLVLATIAAYLLHFTAHGVQVVGEIPRGLEGFSLTGLGIQDLVRLLPGALGLLLVIFAESLAMARTYATRHHYRVDANQEMIALGAANLGSGLLRGFAVDGSLSKTAAAEQAGGVTQLAYVLCSALTFLTLFAIPGLFKYVPEAALAAIVVFAVSGLIEVKPFRRLRRSNTADFALALAALFGVLIFGIMEGIVIGVVLSLAGFVLRASRPHSAVLGMDESGTRVGDLDERPECSPVSPYLIIYRFDSPLIFSNVNEFVDDVRRLVEEADPRPLALIVDCEMIYEMDTTASDEFAELHDELAEEGIEILLARVHAPVRDFMRRDGIIDMVGGENLFYTVRDAVRAFRERHPPLS